MGPVLVVGGVNQDITVAVARRPVGGETLIGDGPRTSPGGKGANQAVAAAYAGAEVRLCAAVGDDAAGEEQIALLQRAGVDVSSVRRAAGTATGTALILVTPDGENSIVVGAGANAVLGPEDVIRALAPAAGAAPSVVLSQSEPGLPAVEAAGREARERGLRLVLNAAPVQGLSDPLLAAADPLVVNEHEARDLLLERGLPVPEDGHTLGEELRERLGCASVVVSLGAEGASVVTADGTFRVAAPVAVAVDTTGAGDVLAGVVAARLSQGVDLRRATVDACALAARAVTSPGARGYLED